MVEHEDFGAEAERADVIIVGCGQSGAAAAHALQQRLKDTSDRPHGRLPQLLVLEATDHVGGRTCNFNLATGQYDGDPREDPEGHGAGGELFAEPADHVVDLGGGWISSEHTAFLALCKDLGVKVFRSAQVEERESDDVDEHGEDAVRVPPEPENVEYPWWFFGGDYPAREFPGMQRSIFHTSEGSFLWRGPADFCSQFRSTLPAADAELVRAGETLVESAGGMLKG